MPAADEEDPWFCAAWLPVVRGSVAALPRDAARAARGAAVAGMRRAVRRAGLGGDARCLRAAAGPLLLADDGDGREFVAWCERLRVMWRSAGCAAVARELRAEAALREGGADGGLPLAPPPPCVDSTPPVLVAHDALQALHAAGVYDDGTLAGLYRLVDAARRHGGRARTEAVARTEAGWRRAAERGGAAAATEFGWEMLELTIAAAAPGPSCWS